jgi:hypothetical protein
MAGLLDFLQAASNAAASNVSGPVDAINWLLSKAGVPVSQSPVGGSQWMEQKGLTRKVPQGAASVLGETAGLLAPFAVAAKAPQIAGGLNQMVANAQTPATMNAQRGAIVWHGSPHKFDRFDSSKIGTGEGAQAYGHGLYLADAPDVARSYAGMNPVSSVKVAKLPDGRFEVLGVRDSGPLMELGEFSTREAAEQAAQAARDAGANLYKVDLPDEQIAKMLDWDKPLSQQAPEVQKALSNAAAVEQDAYGFTAKIGNLMGTGGTRQEAIDNLLSHNAGGSAVYQGMKWHPGVSDAVKGSGVRGSGNLDGTEVLRRAGIPGIRYLDGGSRGAGAGTSNYVVFPGGEDYLTILERNGISVR